MDKYKDFYKNQEDYYKKRFEDFGNSPQGDGWTSEKYIETLFAKATEILSKEIQDKNTINILDRLK